MNRISKRVIAFLLTLVLMLSLCACAQMAQLWAGTDEPNISVDSETPPGKPDKKPPEKPRPGAGGSDVQPAQAGFSAEAEQSLIWLRDRIDFPQTMFGAAYLGYVEEDSRGDWLSAADQAMLEAYPFLAEIDENHIIGSTGHLYCIVPVDENATVAINRVQWNENTYTYENTEVCYRSESGEPVLFFANLNGVAYEADTQVWITDNSGNSCEWYPSLDSMSYLWPCISETGDSFDFTEYGWRGAPSELAPWLADGWSGIYAPGLEGCWTVQAAAWDTGRTANYYLWFFPEDETGGSVRLDWQYEGSDLFEEMWSGYWTITSVMDSPGYVTISLSLVGGENYGVTDGPYYISDTYPLVVSPSGEEMVLGAGENGVSLPFMPKYDAQPCMLTLDSWLSEIESPDW